MPPSRTRSAAAAFVVSSTLALAPARAHAQPAAPAAGTITPLVDARRVGAQAAARVLEAAAVEARRNGWAVSVAVVDPAGALVAFRRDDAAHPASVDLSLGKARTAARFRTTSREIEQLAAARNGFLTVAGITPVEGAVPIVVDGQVVGAVGVSGVTSAQDAQIARAGAEALAAPSRSRGAP
jgi:glc operon protein GlcG